MVWIILGGIALVLVMAYVGDARHASRVAREITEFESKLTFDEQGIETGKNSFLMMSREPACLLVHGFRGSTEVFRELAEFLSSSQITVNALLLPGHGRKVNALAASRWQNWNNAVESAYLHLKEVHEKIFIVGFSLGGLIALRIASRHPVDGVVAISPLISINPKRYGLLSPSLQVSLARFLLFTRILKSNSLPDVLDRDALEKLNTHPFHPIEACRSLLELVDTSQAEIRRVRCPLLVQQSRHDQVVDPQSVQDFYDEVVSGDKKLTWYEDSGHELLLDREKEAVFGEILAFIKKG